ncbi:MAG: methyltransferase domain-containing protein [Pseudonocardia sp.]|uniref:methyltransferase domain-containing protein n=1 Tax=unclassified Pseudonocardia TaxID=2619320 RepID=UPI00086832C3|nr:MULTISPECIES: methyltransferase domain-containing protein [unclassified Pseudonocardia]MBN9111521.1 methyltransferase domain-containing protein [Pseudonocardia sp.]ODU03906.1 MAG: ubiquinone biosynthesis methyltransferase UbiE [Pseudonocardia sp. SCN 72-51]ODV02762.1 MAG: ubiquinone biosynthesis methyltransferase UbiE [Pseudonocardia sp. SCN 73-27]
MPENPDVYTHGHADSVLRSHRNRTAANSAAYLLPHLRPGLSLLDVGSGPGTITADLARLVAPGPTLGIEPVEDPLAEARATGAGIATLRFEVADVYRLDPAAGRYDVVHAHQVLQHLTDPVAALRAMGSVLTDDGVVAVRDADYAAMTWFPADERLDAWLATYRAVAKSNGAEPDAGRRLYAWARKAGFAEVTASASVWCYATPEERAWWGGAWAERITRSRVAEQAVERGIADRGDLEEMSAGWRAWAADPDGWFALLHGEVLARRPS